MVATTKLRNRRSKGRHRKPGRLNQSQWLVAGVLAVGVGAAVASGSGIAAAEPGSADGGSSSTSSNDPTNITTSAPVSYTLGSPPVVVASQVSITDIDSPTMARATVTISEGAQAGDTLGFIDNDTADGITVDSASTPTSIVLTGVGTQAQYEAALENIIYSTTAQNPAPVVKTLSYTVTDPTNITSLDFQTLTVAADRSTPVVTPSAGATTYTENHSPVQVDAGINVGDPDSTVLTGATVTISEGAQAGDTLGFIDNPGDGITVSTVSTPNTLVLTGTGTVTQYQSALRSAVYSTTSEDPSSSPRTVTLIVTDGANTSAPATKTIDVVPVGDPPILHITSAPVSYPTLSHGN